MQAPSQNRLVWQDWQDCLPKTPRLGQSFRIGVLHWPQCLPSQVLFGTGLVWLVGVVGVDTVWSTCDWLCGCVVVWWCWLMLQCDSLTYMLCCQTTSLPEQAKTRLVMPTKNTPDCAIRAQLGATDPTNPTNPTTQHVHHTRQATHFTKRGSDLTRNIGLTRRCLQITWPSIADPTSCAQCALSTKTCRL